MSDTTITEIPDQSGKLQVRRGTIRSALWSRIALAIITLISVFMNFYQLGQGGFGNLYYAAGVKSMMDNLHNFFFVSYDPGGFVTIDKPPLGFWLQVASAKIFGFTPFSVLLPQALAGVLSVLLLYYLVRRHFGVTAGLLAALALAISPISVVTNRNNTIDSTLALAMLIGAWAVIHAAESGRLRWLLLSAAMIGIGFNIKMAEALLVVPAFGVLYILAAPRRVWTRIWHLALALVLLLAISFSWALAVDLTPASQRPYVGSTQDNSEITLAIGYNGINRLLGGFGGGLRGGANRGARTNSTTTNTPPQGASGGNGNAQGQPPSGTTGNQSGGFPGRNASGGNSGGMFNTGTSGPFRLFNEPLGGQIVWLLLIALLGILALAWQRRRVQEHEERRRFAFLQRFQEDRQQQSLLLWGVWLLTMGVFFSVAGFFHQYYLTVMAPAICALFGIGVVVMWNDYRRVGWRGWLLPIALIATALEQINIITSNPSWGMWLIPLIAIPCGLAALILIVARLFPALLTRFGSNERNTFSLQSVIGVALIALLLTPAVWSVIPALQSTASQLPAAGPSGSELGGFTSRTTARRGNDGTNVDTKLIQYLEANQGNATYLVAVPSSNSGDAIILATNKPVMALGGFGGSDPILTTSQLASLVSNGTVRFFLLNGGFSGQPSRSILDQLPPAIRERIEQGGFGGFGGFGGGQSSLTSWVTQHCSVVSADQWKSFSTGGGQQGGNLYDCAKASTKG